MDLAFLYISLPSLLDYDVRMPNFAFYGDVNRRQPNFLSLSKLECDPQEINSREVFWDIFSELEKTRQSLKKRLFILKVTFSLSSLSVVGCWDIDGEEGKRKRARYDGKGKERNSRARPLSRLFPLPIVHRALTIYFCHHYYYYYYYYYSFSEYLVGASAEERD